MSRGDYLRAARRHHHLRAELRGDEALAEWRTMRNSLAPTHCETFLSRYPQAAA